MMIEFIFGGLVIAMLFLALMVVWSRRSLAPRWGAVVIALMIMMSAYPTFTKILSRPKPVGMEWYMRNTKTAILVAYKVDYGKALYLWLMLPNIDEPRAYKLEWSDATKELAKQAQEAMEKAQDTGQPVVIDKPFLPFEKSLEEEKKIYPAPQPKQPDKKAMSVPREFK